MAINIPIITEFSDAGLKSARGAFDQFKTKIGEADGAMGKLKAGSGVAFDTIKANAGAFAIAGGAAMVAFGAKAISAASDFEESTAKIGQLFGDASDSVFDFADDAAQALGQSKQSVLEAAGTFGTFGKAAGLAGEDLSTFSNDFTALASDLASFNNTSPEEAVQALGAALRGESEPLRRYGILLDDASMRQKALELGIISTTKNALTPQQKVLAAQALIFEQSQDAQGDFARTSDGLANQQRILAAELENVTIEIGQKLLPAAVSFVKFANTSLVPVINTLADAFGFVAKGIAEGTEGTTTWYGALIKLLNPVDAYLNALEGDDGAVEQTLDLNRAWEDGYRQMIIARSGVQELTDALEEADQALAELKGNVDERQAWRNLIDDIDQAGEAAKEAFEEATPEALRASEAALDRARLKVGQYVNELDTIPEDKKTEIIASLDNANLAEVEQILNNLARARQIPFMPSLPPGVGGISEIGSGGREIGLPPINYNLLSGVGARSAVTVNVAGSVVTQNDLVESVRKGLVNSQRNGAGLVYSNR
jgi:vacuolar-type H+-ATPase subunit H